MLLFRNSNDLAERCVQVENAVKEYTASMTDLGVAIGIQHLQQGVKILDQSADIIGGLKRIDSHIMGTDDFILAENTRTRRSCEGNKISKMAILFGRTNCKRKGKIIGSSKIELSILDIQRI